MKLKIKEPGSAITHFIGWVMAVLAAAPLLLRSAREPDSIHIIAMSVFMLSMILLYAASTIYHTVDSTEKVNRRLRKMDHMMIFILIAGSYTPICLIVLHGRTGTILCTPLWESLLRPAGSPVPSGFPLSSTLQWGGSVCLLLCRSSKHFLRQDSDGFWQEVSFIQLEVLSMH